MNNTLKYSLAGAVMMLALFAVGCSDPSTKSDDAVESGLKYDSAYLTLATAQNANAIGYAKAILKTDPPADVAKFANTVLTERATENTELARLQKSVNINGTPSVAESAKEFGLTPEELGISADGKPLAAPSTVAGYIQVMTLLDESAITLADKENAVGGPGTRRFAQEAIVQRTAELKALAKLK